MRISDCGLGGSPGGSHEAGHVAPPSRRLSCGHPARSCTSGVGKMPTPRPARCRRYGPQFYVGRGQDAHAQAGKMPALHGASQLPYLASPASSLSACPLLRYSLKWGGSGGSRLRSCARGALWSAVACYREGSEAPRRSRGGHPQTRGSRWGPCLALRGQADSRSGRRVAPPSRRLSCGHPARSCASGVGKMPTPRPARCRGYTVRPRCRTSRPQPPACLPVLYCDTR